MKNRPTHNEQNDPVREATLTDKALDRLSGGRWDNITLKRGYIDSTSASTGDRDNTGWIELATLSQG